MTPPDSVTDVPALYTQLIGSYRDDCRQDELRIMYEVRQNFLLTVLEGYRNAWHGGRTGDPEWRKLPDLFGELVIRRGGLPTLTRLASCNAETLATLAAWNAINDAEWERRFVVRRTITGAFALFTAFGTILKTFNASISAHATLQWLLTHDTIGTYLLSLCVFLMLTAILEALPLRKSQMRIVHFGQILTVAIAFQSKHPATPPPDITPAAVQAKADAEADTSRQTHPATASTSP